MKEKRTANKQIQKVLGLLVTAGVLGVSPTHVWAHCDTLDGPVVTEAREALEKGDVTPVLKWVKKEREPEIREAFERTLIVRAKGPEGRELADTYFFETLVRVHRAGEGAPYTGLAPAGAVEPVVAKADQALEKGSVDVLAKKLAGLVDAGVRKRFSRALEARKHAGDSVEAGREYVEAYVEFVHYAEGLHAIAAGPGAHHAASDGDASHGGHAH
jgi:hypothetical protein